MSAIRPGGGPRGPVPAAALLGRLRPVPVLVRVAVAGTVTESGYLHAKLYVDGYRFIPHIGWMFMLQASVSFAVAALLLLAAPPLVEVVAAGTAAGALGGFVLSRTTGLWGFSERGFQPHPDALLSVLSEAATLVLLAAFWTYTLLRRRAAGEPMPWARWTAGRTGGRTGPRGGRPVSFRAR